MIDDGLHSSKGDPCSCVASPNLNIPAACSGGRSCPDILELQNGDYAVIGTDITLVASPQLPSGGAAGDGERIVQIPRALLVQAKSEIPSVILLKPLDPREPKDGSPILVLRFHPVPSIDTAHWQDPTQSRKGLVQLSEVIRLVDNAWLRDNSFSLIQTIGIVASLFFTSISLCRDLRLGASPTSSH